MLDYDRLKLAIEIHGQCYQLLRWVSDAIDKGFIRFTKAHEFTSLGGIGVCLDPGALPEPAC